MLYSVNTAPCLYMSDATSITEISIHGERVVFTAEAAALTNVSKSTSAACASNKRHVIYCLNMRERRRLVLLCVLLFSAVCLSWMVKRYGPATVTISSIRTGDCIRPSHEARSPNPDLLD